MRAHPPREGVRRKGRPELEKLLSALRNEGEVVVVKLDRISRSTRHLIGLTEEFDEIGVDFISLNDSIDTTMPMDRFFFRVMAPIAELERDMIVERTKNGLSVARGAMVAGARRLLPGRFRRRSTCTNPGRSPSRRSRGRPASARARCTEALHTKPTSRRPA